MSHDALHLIVHIISVHVAILIVHLLDDPQISIGSARPVLPPRLEPHLLDVMNLLVKAFVLKTVSVDLGLVVFEFSDHVFKLSGTIFQVLLVDLKFFCHFWATLLG